MARRAALPTTGPAGSAAQRQQRAADMLAERDAAKRAAALKPAGSDQSRENLAAVKRAGDGPWIADHRDSLSGVKRNP
jgi:hypothetical protein